MSLGGIAIAIGAMVDAAIVLVENAHKHLETAPAGADRRRVLIDAAKEVGPPIFFSLLIITVAFLPIFALNGQAGRLFKPLAYTKTFAMAFAALVSITLAPALMTSVRARPHPPRGRTPGVARADRLYRPFAWVALKNPQHHDRDRPDRRAVGGADGVPTRPRVHAAAQRGRPPLHADHLAQHLDRGGQATPSGPGPADSFGSPRSSRVFGKAGRAETPTDPAPLSMVETVVQLKPREQWRMVDTPRWYSAWAPPWLAAVLRPFWPDRRRITWDELVAELNRARATSGLDQCLDHADQDPHRHALDRDSHADRDQDLRRQPGHDRADRDRSRAHRVAGARHAQRLLRPQHRRLLPRHRPESRGAGALWPDAWATFRKSSRRRSAASRSRSRSTGAPATPSTCATRASCVRTWSSLKRVLVPLDRRGRRRDVRRHGHGVDARAGRPNRSAADTCRSARSPTCAS